jgi:hypothetical protein
MEILPVPALMGIREAPERGGGDAEGDCETIDLPAAPGSEGNGWERVHVLPRAGCVDMGVSTSRRL